MCAVPQFSEEFEDEVAEEDNTLWQIFGDEPTESNNLLFELVHEQLVLLEFSVADSLHHFEEFWIQCGVSLQ